MQKPRRYRFYDVHPLEPASPEAERVQRFDEFEAERPPVNKAGERRNLLIRHRPLPDEKLVLDGPDEGGFYDLVLISPAEPDVQGDIPPGASGEGTRDRVHRLSGTDPLLQRMNTDNRRFYDTGVTRKAGYREGTDSARLRQQNEANKRYYGIG